MLVCHALLYVQIWPKAPAFRRDRLSADIKRQSSTGSPLSSHLTIHAASERLQRWAGSDWQAKVEAFDGLHSAMQREGPPATADMAANSDRLVVLFLDHLGMPIPRP